MSDDGRQMSLAGCDLVSVPEWLGDLTDLTELDLSGNQVTSLPDWLGNLTSLTELDLRRNQLNGLPDSLGNLTAVTELDLSGNKVTALPESLGNLTSLTVLRLTGNQLTALPDSLGNLTALTELGLRRNQLTTLPEWLGSLTNLNVLQLGGNQLTALPDSLGNLTALAELDLKRTELTALPEWLGDLTALIALHLGGSQLAVLPDSLGNLTGLTTLFLLDTQLTSLPESLGNLGALCVLGLGGSHLAVLPDSLGNLTGLTTLYLVRTQVTALPDSVGNLASLTELHLGDNQLTALPDSLGNLTALTRLDLRRNLLTALPDSVGNLASLTELHLGGNQLTALPHSLGNLTALGDLGLGGNQLTMLPAWLGNFTGLTELSLRRNQLTALPDSVGNLASLTELHLGGNQLTALPHSLGNLTALGDLGLGGNQLTALPDSLGNLTALGELGLRRNQLTDLPEWLGNLTTLTVLHLDGNPLRSPLLEITEGGSAAVKAYLSLAAEHSAELWKSKLLVVGQGAVGKTSLVKVLAGQEFDRDEPTTHEIRIEEIEFDHPERPDVKMHLVSWDFGGQDIYHATHQFFLTDRSLFLLLWNARQGWEQAKLHYWLDIIKARAPHARVILVATFSEGRPISLPLSDLKASYPQIVASASVDSSTGEGVDELRRQMAYEAAKLPLMGSRWPETWMTGVEEINRCSEQHATPEYLYTRLATAGVTDPSHQTYLLRVMHLLGDILFFDEDEELSDMIILRPQWVSAYIARVLDSPEVAAHGGVLTRSHERQCWSDLDPGLRDRFLRMMEKFDLSYRIPEDTAAACLVVECLPWDRPPYEATWERVRTEQGAREIRLRYQLGSLPPGVPTWFIAREHRFRSNGYQWRSGALLRYTDDSRVFGLILAERNSRTVDLAVRGPVPQYFFGTSKMDSNPLSAATLDWKLPRWCHASAPMVTAINPANLAHTPTSTTYRFAAWNAGEKKSNASVVC